MSGDREAEVLALLAEHGQRLTRLTESRCARDGRLLGATYRLPDGIWIWSAGHRQPPQVVRHQAAAAYVDGIDDCATGEQVQACYDLAAEALVNATRPKAEAAVAKIRSNNRGGWSYELARPFAMSLVCGPDFAVTEVSCGCRRHYYLDIHTLVKVCIGQGVPVGRPVQVAPLPPDLPQRQREHLLPSQSKARACFAAPVR